ncbi:MAG: DEAD/DEAH box helicase [Clostridium lundense]|nr:DEAD/DEAH box helicase [Clostridium lundense]
MDKLNFHDFNISTEIIEALNKMGYENPSGVQEKVIPLMLNDKDIIVKSQTGSGKTAAFGVPICEKITWEENKPQALVLTPTRELAIQVKEDINNIGRLKRIRAVAVFGKHPMEIQKRELKQRVHIIVGTPGRTMDHIERGNINLEEIKYLIIDEADEMLNMGFIDQVAAIIEKMPKNRVTVLLSATMPEEIELLCKNYMVSPMIIEINPESITTERVEEVYYETPQSDKLQLLNKIIYTERPDSSIIFCSTKEGVDNLVRDMKDRGYSCKALHGGMEQKDRIDIMKQFKRGEFTFLIATDVAARGIHVEDITHVINYDTPVEKESYVHRIGRTGRAGNKGKAITFVSPREERMLRIIEDYIGYSIPLGHKPSEEEVREGKEIFREQSKSKPKLKVDKSASLNKEITKIHINAGKKKKIRAGDIVGTITSIEGVSAEDIGIIDVQDNFSYVDILQGKGKIVLKELQDKTIKGKKVRIQRAVR